MADPRIYENAAVFIQGGLVTESTSIGVTYEDGDKPLPLIGGRFGIDAGTRLSTEDFTARRAPRRTTRAFSRSSRR